MTERVAANKCATDSQHQQQHDQKFVEFLDGIPYPSYFPLCSECSRSIDLDIEKGMSDLNRDILNLEFFLEKFGDLPPCNHTELNTVEEECKRLRQLVLEEERESELLNATLLHLQKEESNLDRLEVSVASDYLSNAVKKEYWKAYGKYRKELVQIRADATSLNLLLEYSYNRLRKTCALVHPFSHRYRRQSFVLNDAFHIWHNGHFGTVNGCRLGKLPRYAVPGQFILTHQSADRVYRN